MTTDGYFSFGRAATCCPSIAINNSNSDYIVAPFEADTNIGSGQGSVAYEVHNSSINSHPLSRVNTFIRQQMQNKFVGNWMLVAEWRNVPQSGQANTIVRQYGLSETQLLTSLVVDKYFPRDCHNQRLSVVHSVSLPLWQSAVVRQCCNRLQSQR